MKLNTASFKQRCCAINCMSYKTVIWYKFSILSHMKRLKNWTYIYLKELFLAFVLDQILRVTRLSYFFWGWGKFFVLLCFMEMYILAQWKKKDTNLFSTALQCKYHCIFLCFPESDDKPNSVCVSKSLASCKLLHVKSPGLILREIFLTLHKKK